jgi:hypothetical protein
MAVRMLLPVLLYWWTPSSSCLTWQFHYCNWEMPCQHPYGVKSGRRWDGSSPWENGNARNRASVRPLVRGMTILTTHANVHKPYLKPYPLWGPPGLHSNSGPATECDPTATTARGGARSWTESTNVRVGSHGAQTPRGIGRYTKYSMGTGAGTGILLDIRALALSCESNCTRWHWEPGQCDTDTHSSTAPHSPPCHGQPGGQRTKRNQSTKPVGSASRSAAGGRRRAVKASCKPGEPKKAASG